MIPVEFPNLDIQSKQWTNFEAKEKAVLCFVINAKKEEILLIEKKRGLGAGKINGPGGKLEGTESYEEAAIRETEEEVGITPINPECRAQLYFEFQDGHSIYGEVFFAYEYSGELIETDEALPFWHPIKDLPLDRMWSDDSYWLPQAIQGHTVEGKFYFDDDTLLHGQVRFDCNASSIR